jgi:cytochrome P450
MRLQRRREKFKLRENQGPIIRINPDELHVKDAEFYDEIYAGGSKKRDKYDKWIMMAGAPRSTFSTVDHDVHRMRRGALNPFFAKRSVVRLEPRIQEKVTTLCNRLAQCMSSGQVVRLDAAFMALTMDVITEYCYGTSYDYISEPDFKLEWKEAMATLFEGAAFRRAVPWLTKLLQTFPDKYILNLMPQLGILINWQKDIKRQVQEVVNSPKDKSDTIFHALRDNELAPSERDIQRLADEGEILVAAGSETTAKTLSITAFHIISNPPVLTRLREELMTVMPYGTSNPTWTALEQLPYLVSLGKTVKEAILILGQSAVVSEGLRISYGITTRLPRLPHEALKYKQWTIPARVSVFPTCGEGR